MAEPKWLPVPKRPGEEVTCRDFTDAKESAQGGSSEGFEAASLRSEFGTFKSKDSQIVLKEKRGHEPSPGVGGAVLSSSEFTVHLTGNYPRTLSRGVT